MLASRKSRIAAIAAATAVIGGMAASSAPAFAATSDVPAGSLTITITNPAAATVSINPPPGGVTIDATRNISQASAYPDLGFVQGGGADSGSTAATGALGLTVQTNNQHGYAVDATGDPNQLHSPGNPTVTNADLHLTTATGTTNNSVTLASATLDSPVTVLSNSEPSNGKQVDKLPSARVANQDSTVFGFWILPNALLGGQNYASTIGFVFIPAP